MTRGVTNFCFSKHGAFRCFLFCFVVIMVFFLNHNNQAALKGQPPRSGPVSIINRNNTRSGWKGQNNEIWRNNFRPSNYKKSSTNDAALDEEVILNSEAIIFIANWNFGIQPMLYFALIMLAHSLVGCFFCILCCRYIRIVSSHGWKKTATTKSYRLLCLDARSWNRLQIWYEV